MEHEIDGWIEQLSQCKQLTEADVKRLCDKVIPCSAPLRFGCAGTGNNVLTTLSYRPAKF